MPSPLKINMGTKKRTKKKIADNKQLLYGTGGGPFMLFNELDVDNDVQEILGSRVFV